MNRRALLSVATTASSVLIAGGMWPAAAQQLPLRTRPRTFVLIHGAFNGGWCWRDVAANLTADGHKVYAPTQTGCGERAHLVTKTITLETFATDICNVLEFNELSDVVLVGHSFGGLTALVVADRMPERLYHIVYLDSLLVNVGQAPIEGLPSPVQDFFRKSAQESSAGVTIMAPPAVGLNVTDAGQAAWLTRHLTPQPLSVFESKLMLKKPYGNGVPSTYITCVEPLSEALAGSRTIANARADWKKGQIKTGHSAMVTAPNELADLLRSAGT